jgi:hypothetical protein
MATGRCPSGFGDLAGARRTTRKLAQKRSQPRDHRSRSGYEAGSRPCHWAESLVAWCPSLWSPCVPSHRLLSQSLRPQPQSSCAGDASRSTRRLTLVTCTPWTLASASPRHRSSSPAGPQQSARRQSRPHRHAEPGFGPTTTGSRSGWCMSTPGSLVAAGSQARVPRSCRRRGHAPGRRSAPPASATP